VDEVTAIMTTIPSRGKALLEVIDSIYDQVDSIRVVFNGYTRAPEWTKRMSKVVSYVDSSNKYSDCAKWRIAPDKGYVFSVDDDIYYPKDYVSVLIEKIEEYDRKKVVTVHGSYFKLPFLDFRKSKRCFHFSSKLDEDVQVNLVGSGTLGYHTDTIKPKFSDFISPGRSDIWFSALCYKKHVPIVCIAREEGWLRPVPVEGPSIWDRTRMDKDFLDKNTEYVARYIIPYVEKE